MRALLLSLLIIQFISETLSFTITSSKTDNGGELDYPARTDNGAPPIHLECNLDFNTREKWTTCKWTKLFPEVPVDWTQRSTSSLPYAFIMCTATHYSDNHMICEDQGNLNNEYYGNPLLNPYTQYDTDRLSYSVSEDVCGLTITNPHANDTGIWKCTVTDNNPEGTPVSLFKEVKVYTAQKSSVNITEPDLVANPTYSITVDMSDRSQVDLETLECTASGSPPPNIVWYIDQRTNRIDRSLYSERRVQKDDFNVHVVSTLSRLTLDRNILSRYGIRPTNSYFAFSVGCYADQNNYFPDINSEWNNMASEIMVYGTSGAMNVMAGVTMLAVMMSMLM